MVFYGFFHYLDLLRREPPAQSGIGSENLTTCEVMYGSWPGEPQIVVGGGNVGHIAVGSDLLRQFQCTPNYTRNVG
jgi:hypothetical protein